MSWTVAKSEKATMAEGPRISRARRETCFVTSIIMVRNRSFVASGDFGVLVYVALMTSGIMECQHTL